MYANGYFEGLRQTQDTVSSICKGRNIILEPTELLKERVATVHATEHSADFSYHATNSQEE